MKSSWAMKGLGMALALLVIVVTGGCTPEYNWRETTVALQRAEIAFPGKIQTEVRDLDFEGRKMAFSLVSAQVGPSVFAVGSLELPETMTSVQAEALAGLFMQGLARNAGAALSITPKIGEMFEIEGKVAGQASRVWAKVLVHRGVLLQVTVSGPVDKLKTEQAMTFMQSLRLK
jgi:hypothetical protein